MSGLMIPVRAGDIKKDFKAIHTGYHRLVLMEVWFHLKKCGYRWKTGSYSEGLFGSARIWKIICN